MKIAIIGTGGVGGYFGGRLADAGIDVSFLARGAHLDAIKKSGLRVKSVLGDFRVEGMRATDCIKDIGEADLIILGVKAEQIREIREDLKWLIHENSMVLPLQNGVMAADELSEVLDRKNVLGGLCRIISQIESPGVINHTGVTPTIIFGELDKTANTRLQAVKALFDQAGIKSRISDDIHVDLWKKFIAICISGLMAVTRTNHGELRTLKETRQMMIDLLTEVFVLSRRAGVNIEDGYIDKTVSFIDAMPPEATASLTRDVLAGRPSEIYYQNGAVVKLGEIYGIETPVNKFVFYTILPMELKARGVKI